MSNFASPEAAAFVECALALPQHEAIRTLTNAGHDEPSRDAIILAMAEALVGARTHAVATGIASEHAVSDDVLCTWDWGRTPRFDATSQRIGIPVLLGRRSVWLWLPLQDAMAMANSFLANEMRSALKHRLSPVPEAAE